MCYLLILIIELEWLQLDSNPQTLNLWTNTQPYIHTDKNIESIELKFKTLYDNRFKLLGDIFGAGGCNGDDGNIFGVTEATLLTENTIITVSWRSVFIRAVVLLLCVNSAFFSLLLLFPSTVFSIILIL